MNAVDLFENAELALAAYANLLSGATNSDPNQQALIKAGMSIKQADEFAKIYPTVVTQYSDAATSFSAAVFKDNAGNLTLAIRGTLELGDFGTDITLTKYGAAYDQIVEMYNWWQKVSNPEGTLVKQYQISTYSSIGGTQPATGVIFLYSTTSETGVISSVYLELAGQVMAASSAEGNLVTAIASDPDHKIDVAGHSLGGHLAMAFGSMFGDMIDQIITFNAPGFTSTNINVEFFKELGGIVPNGSNTINVVADEANAGDTPFNKIAGLWSRPGNKVDIAIENQFMAGEPNPLGAMNHSQSTLTDAFAVFSMLARLDPSLSTDTFKRLMDSADNYAYKSLERIVDSVQYLLLDDKEMLPTGNGEREALYNAIYNLMSVDGKGNPTGAFAAFQGKVKVTDTLTIASNARNDFCALLGLVCLTPFALQTADAGLVSNLKDIHKTVAEKWEEDQKLSPVERAHGMANFSDEYLAGRAAMLSWIVKCNNLDCVDITVLGASGQYFLDVASGKEVWTRTSFPADPRRIIFGDENANSLNGATNSDRLYGGDGNDVLSGNDNSDYLEGGAGDDILNGGKGSDRLFGGKGNDIYQFVSGDGNDVIMDSDGDADIVRMADNVLPTDVAVSRDYYNLYLSLNNGTDKLTITNWFNVNMTQKVESVTFSDGTRWGVSELLQQLPVGQGTENDDEIYGHDTDDFISGAGGNDKLYGAQGNDILDGGTGNDVLVGGGGNDTYIFGRGYGQDVISEFETAIGNVDTLQILEGVSPSDIIVTRDSFNLYLTINGTDDKLTLQNWYSAKEAWVERIVFADGTTWAPAEFASVPLLGTQGNDSIDGSPMDDVIDGSAGNDRLNGILGNDTYIFGKGYGQDVVFDYSGSDSIQMGTGIKASDVTVTRDDSNLYLSINGSDDKLTLQGWYLTSDFQVERVVFADGTIWTTSDLANAPFVGTDGSENINGSMGNDVILGLGGDDSLNGYAGDDRLDGGTGNDALNGHDGNDTYVFGKGYGQDVVFDYAGFDSIQMGIGIKASDVTVTRDDSNLYLSIQGSDDKLTLQGWYWSPSLQIERVIFEDGTIWDKDTLLSHIEILPGTDGNDAIYGTDRADILNGAAGDDSLYGYAGNDILLGGNGNDVLYGSTGNNLMSSGAGDDTVAGGADNEFFVGGSGNDTIDTSTGYDVVAFNRGDGQDVINASVGSDNTLSLGGGITYADLLFSKSGNDLILTTGTSEQVTFQDWYASTDNQSIANLQVVIEGTSDYNPSSGSAINDNKVEQFDFANLVGAFDQAMAADSTLTSWSLLSSLLAFHLSGSDTAAIGGDLAYQYAMNGSLSNVSAAPALAVISDAQFGVGNQNLQQVSNLQDQTARLM